MAPVDDAANPERAPNKRPSSPAASSHQNQPSKRPCTDQQNSQGLLASGSLTRCLHCGAGGHTFSTCIGWCKDCGVGRPAVFCPMTRDRIPLPGLGAIARADPDASVIAGADASASATATATADATSRVLSPSTAPPKQVASSPAVVPSDAHRVPEKPLAAPMRCLKCGKDGHLPANCTLRLFGAPSASSKDHVSSQAVVTDGDGREPAKLWNAARRPSVGTPNMEGVSSERLAMIGATPEVTNKTKSMRRAHKKKKMTSQSQQVPQSGTNAMPLGGPNRCSLPGSAVQGGVQRDLATPPPMPDAPRGPARGRAAPTAPASMLHPAGHMTGYGTASPLGPPPSRADGFGIYGASKQQFRPANPYPPRSSSTNSAPRAYDQRRSLSSTDTNVFNMTPNAITQANKLRDAVGRSDEQNVERYSAHHMGIWADLTDHIANVVHGARDHARATNNGEDDGDVKKALRDVNKLLRPYLLRDKRPSQAKQTGGRVAFARVHVGEDGFPLAVEDDCT
ncbi:hypothetical protein BST61_g5434 [Cercospora zeina]